ncbi:MAG: hypothetical protein AAFO07_01210 [Bacteroidota bacterium]
MNKHLKKIILDMIPVILGVLIALFIDGWKTSLMNKRYVDKVMGAIQLEMEGNIQDIEKVITLQKALVDTITEYIEVDTLSLTDLIIKADGLKVATVQGSSWRAFLNSKIELIDYQSIIQLSSINENKEILRLKVDKMLEFLSENFESTEKKHKKMLILQISNVGDSENALLQQQKAFLGIEEEEDF